MISERTPKYDFHGLLHHADMTRTKDIVYEQVQPQALVHSPGQPLNRHKGSLNGRAALPYPAQRPGFSSREVKWDPGLLQDTSTYGSGCSAKYAH